jgi:signal transduction histidine kinase/HPt (histidine-containing phosphotransfer) domain-containing protein
VNFDIPTLSIITALAQFAFVMACVTLIRLVREVESLHDWIKGSSLVALAAVLVGLRGMIPEILSVVIANALSLLGLCFIHAGVRGLLQRGRPSRWIWAVPALSVPLFAWFTLVTPNIPARIMVYSLGTLPMLGASAWEFLRHDRQSDPTPLRSVNRITALIFGAGALIFLTRTVIASGLPADASYLQTSNPLVAAPYLYAIVFSVWLSIMVTLTVSARLQQDLLEARDRAEAANRAKGLFLANMSHEVRTPMNGVLGMAQLLQQTPLSAEQHDYVNGIRGSTQNLLMVINDILDFSKVEAGKLTLENISFHPRELMQVLETQFAPMAGQKHLQLTLATAADVPTTIVGDQARLNQILVNLLSNAIKFTSRGTVEVQLSLIARNDRLRFDIRDSGIGMAPEALAGLFTPFFQADASITRRFGGTGLGLSIAHHLVGLMGGEIKVTSEVGQGSCFSVEIPFTAASEPQQTNGFPIFDATALLGNFVGDEEIGYELASLVRTEIPTQFAALDQALEQNDPALVARIVHTMKGLAGQAGGARLTANLKLVHDGLRNGHPLTPEMVAGLRHDWEQLDQALAGFVTLPASEAAP